MQVDQEADELIHRLINSLRDVIAVDPNGHGYTQVMRDAYATLDAAKDAGFTQMEG